MQTSATATFRLYSDADCQVQVGNEVRTIPAGAAATVAGVLVNTSGAYPWTVQFSGDQFNTGFTMACGSEITAITSTQ